MVCPECKKKNHDQCADNPRKLAFARKELKGIPDGTASRWCDCQHAEPVIPLPVKGVSE
jgi:hypothetical protein